MLDGDVCELVTIEDDDEGVELDCALLLLLQLLVFIVLVICAANEFDEEVVEGLELAKIELELLGVDEGTELDDVLCDELCDKAELEDTWVVELDGCPVEELDDEAVEVEKGWLEMLELGCPGEELVIEECEEDVQFEVQLLVVA